MQAGGHRFDPGQLHQPLIHCVQFGAFFIEGFDLEAGYDPQFWIGQVSTASGLVLLDTGEDLMFDNEIDWVTQIGKPHVRR